MPGSWDRRHAIVNLALIQRIAASYAPNAQLLWFASWIAERSSWVCLALLAGVAWRQPAQRSYAMADLVAAAVAAVATHALANATHLPGPFVAGLSPSYIAHGARGSLPSAHAAVMFTLALVMLLRPGLRRMGLAIFAIALVTGWARNYVGVHFPLDIPAGLALAWSRRCSGGSRSGSGASSGRWPRAAMCARSLPRAPTASSAAGRRRLYNPSCFA